MLRYFHLVLLSVLWIAYLLNRRSLLGKFLLILCLITVFFFSLYYNGIINSEFTLDRERLFFINSNFDLHIRRFSEWSVYLPYRLRNLVFSSWILSVNILGRSFSYFWFDKAMAATGMIILLPILLALKRNFSSSIAPLLVIYASALAGSLSRDPNTSMVYFLVWPQLLTLVYLGLSPIHETH